MLLLGYIMQIKFKLDLSTLAKVNIYFLAPGFIFNALYHANISGGIFSQVLLFLILLVVILYIIARLISVVFKMDQDTRTVFTNSAMFFNSGNYGVPVNDLVFQGDPYAMSIQVVTLTFQNMFLFSYGVFSLRASQKGTLSAILGYLRMPVLYALLAGISFNLLDVRLPEFILTPSQYIANAMVGIALFMLGAQVAMIKFSLKMGSVYLSLLLRLIVGPAVALALIYLFGLEGMTAQALLIASSMPTSVNTAIIAQEYSDSPDYAAQIVLFSTLLSALTVTFVIYLARFLF